MPRGRDQRRADAPAGSRSGMRRGHADVVAGPRQPLAFPQVRIDMNQKVEKPKEKIAPKPPKNLPVKKDGIVKGGRYIQI